MESHRNWLISIGEMIIRQMQKDWHGQKEFRNEQKNEIYKLVQFSEIWEELLIPVLKMHTVYVSLHIKPKISLSFIPDLSLERK
jgi:hypothetical protein